MPAKAGIQYSAAAAIHRKACVDWITRFRG
ncbi:MAG: hypothetical protein QOD09_2694 [Bradyrhizobium sp.]|jgi:hypothetical protein|nr:hypothetical protein [Bradyrhizobium sp.]